MSSETATIQRAEDEGFETGQVLTIASGHFIHDVYTAFVAPLLPLIIEKLSLSLTLAGSLTAILQLPSLFNPFIGYLADKASLRYFVILAPAVTATLISSMGFASNYFILATILFVTGISVAAFHAPAPVMVAEISAKKVGQGMSLFMAGGELGRTVGPLLAVWAVSTWTLDGYYRIVVLGWAASLLLYIRLNKLPARPSINGSNRAILPFLKTLFLPLLLINLFRNFLITSLAIYLPTFMSTEGASLFMAGGALSIYELAGVAGALTSGILSDRLGRKFVLLAAALASAAALLVFLNVQGWTQAVVLLVLGFSSLSTTPVLLATVQEHLPQNRAVGNGLFMSINFLMQLVSILGVGLLGDLFSLRAAFFWSAILSLLAIPPILALPAVQEQD
jgi:FSR family fosmidomycin resistance protein-like MFS transporter